MIIVITIRNFGSWSYEGGHIVRGLWDLLTVLPSQELEECKYEPMSNMMSIIPAIKNLKGTSIDEYKLPQNTARK